MLKQGQKYTNKKINCFNAFIGELKFHKKSLKKLIAEKQQYLASKTISDDNDCENQIIVDASKKYDELVSDINEHNKIVTDIIRNDMKIEINNWKNQELKLEFNLLELKKEMPNLILLNDTQLVNDLVHKRPKWYARFKFTKWLNQNWSDQYEEWETIKNKLKINLSKQNKDGKVQFIDPTDFLSNRNQKKISNWNEKLKKIKTEMINLHALKLITTNYWKETLKKVNAGTVSIKIKDLIEEEYKDNFVIFSNINNKEIDEQFQLFQDEIIKILRNNEVMIERIFNSLKDKVLKFSNDLLANNKKLDSLIKEIEKKIQNFKENEINIENIKNLFEELSSDFKEISPHNSQVIETITDIYKTKNYEFDQNNIENIKNLFKNYVLELKEVIKKKPQKIKDIFKKFEDEIGNNKDLSVIFTKYRKKINSLMLEINENNIENIDVIEELYLQKIKQNKNCIKDAKLENRKLNHQHNNITKNINTHQKSLQKTIELLDKSIIQWSTKLHVSLKWVKTNEEFLKEYAYLFNQYYKNFVNKNINPKKKFSRIQNQFLKLSKKLVSEKANLDLIQSESNIQMQWHNKYAAPSEATITETKNIENKKLSLKGKYEFLVTKSATKMFEQLKDLIIKENEDVDNGSIYCQVDNEISVGFGKLSFKLKKPSFITMPNTSGNVFTSAGQTVVGTNKREKSNSIQELTSLTTDCEVDGKFNNIKNNNLEEKSAINNQTSSNEGIIKQRSQSLK